jgi:hypothetical protein
MGSTSRGSRVSPTQVTRTTTSTGSFFTASPRSHTNGPPGRTLPGSREANVSSTPRTRLRCWNRPPPSTRKVPSAATGALGPRPVLTDDGARKRAQVEPDDASRARGPLPAPGGTPPPSAQGCPRRAPKAGDARPSNRDPVQGRARDHVAALPSVVTVRSAGACSHPSSLDAHPPRPAERREAAIRGRGGNRHIVAWSCAPSRDSGAYPRGRTSVGGRRAARVGEGTTGKRSVVASAHGRPRAVTPISARGDGAPAHPARSPVRPSQTTNTVRSSGAAPRIHPVRLDGRGSGSPALVVAPRGPIASPAGNSVRVRIRDRIRAWVGRASPQKCTSV